MTTWLWVGRILSMDYLAAMRSFVRAVELGSFSQVAAETGMKVSTVSRYVSALETDLGAALLNRSTRGLHLTEVGQTFFNHAVRIIEDVEQARTLAAAFNTTPQGVLRVTMPSAFGRRHVMPHLPAFLDAYPAIGIDATLTDKHIDMIEAGLDLAIRIGNLPDSGLIARRLALHRRVLCASPDYVAARGRIAQPADLVGQEALVFTLQTSATWHFHHRASGERTSVKVAGRMRVNDSEALLTCAVAGRGIAVLPTWLVRDDIATGALVPLLPDWDAGIVPEFDQAIWAVYPPKKIVSPKVRAFIGFLDERFHDDRYWEVAPAAP